MSIKAAQVKELRDSTGVGMMECKKALVETGGDLQKAIVWLRERGLSRAQKKAGRTAAEGVVTVAVDSENKAACLVEINSRKIQTRKSRLIRAFTACLPLCFYVIRWKSASLQQNCYFLIIK